MTAFYKANAGEIHSRYATERMNEWYIHRYMCWKEGVGGTFDASMMSYIYIHMYALAYKFMLFMYFSFICAKFQIYNSDIGRLARIYKDRRTDTHG